jgi:hypothetical protein
MIEVDRFEPYSSMAFKRRAVSPSASLSPALGSPILGFQTPFPPPLPLSGGGLGPSSSAPLSSTSSAQTTTTSVLPPPISIPSPTANVSHSAFFSALSGGGLSLGVSHSRNGSRAGSPVAPSSLSSSAGKAITGVGPGGGGGGGGGSNAALPPLPHGVAGGQAALGLLMGTSGRYTDKDEEKAAKVSETIGEMTL